MSAEIVVANAVKVFGSGASGVAALQEAGWVAVSVAPVPHIELLGIHPTWQSLLAELAILVLLAVGFVFNIRRGRRPMPSPLTAGEVPPMRTEGDAI